MGLVLKSIDQMEPNIMGLNVADEAGNMQTIFVEKYDFFQKYANSYTKAARDPMDPIAGAAEDNTQPPPEVDGGSTNEA